MSEAPVTGKGGAGRTYTIFLHFTALPAWLALTRSERGAVIERHVRPLLERYAGTTRLDWFDAEAWSASPTDVAVVTTTDMGDWYDLWEGLRDTPLFGVPYFRHEQTITTVGDGFADYERRNAPS
ncbi:darcynin family protein [Nonomuraea fastidiosa]|jgi:hypothetical protein|uniref:darcynin family protein n=1 Tax=Nonomuraea TaxID=83681 RepID=UPI00342C1937